MTFPREITPHPKPEHAKGNRPRRAVDHGAVRLAALADRECAACGGPGANGHHVLPKDRGGDDVQENIVSLCGSGTSGCHGAQHGNPYTVQVPSTFPFEEGRMTTARRDAGWVNWRIGQTLATRRQDVIAYVLGKLGEREGRNFLSDTYRLELP